MEDTYVATVLCCDDKKFAMFVMKGWCAFFVKILLGCMLKAWLLPVERVCACWVCDHGL
jgi:hypothetical protein